MRTRGYTILKFTLGLLAVVGLIGYGVFQARQILEGPVIVIESPQNGTTLHSGMVTVEGQASNISSIQLNSRPIYVDEEGQFAESVVLSRGLNVVTVEAEDRFGRSTDDSIQILFSSLGDSGDSQLSHQPRSERNETP